MQTKLVRLWSNAKIQTQEGSLGGERASSELSHPTMKQAIIDQLEEPKVKLP